MSRIGLDLDGCLYDFAEAHRTYLVEHLHLGPRSAFPDPPQWNTWESWGMSFDEWQRTFDEGIAAGVIFAGGKRYLYKDALWAARAMRMEHHELHIITNRPAGTEAVTQRWLDEIGLPYESITYTADKTSVPVDIMIEDNVDNALACIAAGSLAILIDRPWNRTWDVDGERKIVAYLDEAKRGLLMRATSWDQAVDLVNDHAGYRQRSKAPASARHAVMPIWDDDPVDDMTNPKDLIGDTKPPVHLVPASALLYMSRVMALGADKYGPYNWRLNRVKRTVYLAAAMRHILQALDGEDIDPESGMPHEAHAMSCMGIVLDALATGNLIDDRPTAGAASRVMVELTEVPA